MEGVLYALTLMLRHQALGALPLLGSGHVVIYLPAPCPLPVAPHDFSRSAELIRLGHATASAFLADLRLHGPGIYGHPHFHSWDEGAPGRTALEQVEPAGRRAAVAEELL